MIRIRKSSLLAFHKAKSLAQKQTTRAFASTVHRNAEYSPGDQLHGYTVKKVTPIPELFLTAIHLSHDKTGAQHLHVKRDDANNVFGVAFRTTPMDHTGVPHILEHTVLCGSKKYPVRDPFFKMLNRSLSTFMNAFTANDWTMYPFSTQNPQDYKNLMSVYLDAVFFPQLKEMDFRQEGWRLENEDLSDPKSPIVFKGVVYNEMKGVYSDSQSVFAETAQTKLLPDHTYGVRYGGDPEHIPELTWKQLKDFHASHYHPSNSRFYTYGNLPLEDHLQFINENALKSFDKINPNTDVPPQPRWNKSREASITCNPDPMAPDPNKQTTVAVSYLLGDITDTFEAATLSIIGSLLVNGEKAPFYQSLLEANIGSDFSPALGYDGNIKESTFAIGLQGIHENDVEKVKEIIEKTIDKVIEEGFEQDRIDAIIHKIELGQKHQYDKFGLYLGVNLLPVWNHGGDPIDNLQINAVVDKFTKTLKENPKFLQEKVKYYFKENPHKLTLVMKPDENHEVNRQKKEADNLNKLVSKLSQEEQEEVFKKGQELAQKQMEEEDLSCLPSLKISDIEKTSPTVKIGKSYADNVEIQSCEQPTCGVTYFRAVSNIADLPMELKPYIPLFCAVVTKMGAGTMDFKELSQQIDLTTGGLSASSHICDHPSAENNYEQGVLFSSYCLDRNTEKMFNLWAEIFTNLDLKDTNRLTTLVKMCAAEMASSLAGSGHAYAMKHAASSLNPAAQLRETMGGVTQANIMKAVAEMHDLSPVIDHLREIATHVLTKDHLRCSVNATPENMNSALKLTEKFVSHLKAHKKVKKESIFSQETGFLPATQQTHIVLPFQVNYMGRACRTVPFTHEDFASLRILGRLMTNKFLHREIREKGGAYGGGASGNQSGVFNFYSYRDPNSLKTLEAFENGIEWAKAGKFSQQDIDESKLAIFSDSDMPVPPGNKGMRQFLMSIDDETRQRHREQLFAVDKSSLTTVADRYLSTDSRTSSVSFLGPENQETKTSNNWKLKVQ